MANLAITGLISGLDTDSIITSLVELQRTPITLLEQKQAVQNNKLVALQTLNAHMLNLSISTETLSNPLTFQTYQATSSDSSVVTASTSSSASVGSHSIEVQTLARSQSIAGGTFSSDQEELGLVGQFRLDGEVITIDEADNLASIAATINNQVSTARASVLQVADDEYRLVVTRRTAGTESMELFAASSDDILQDLGLVTGTTTVANPVTNGGSSAGFSWDTTAVGTLLDLNSAPSGTITLDDGSGAISVAIDLETNSLQDIADAINAEATAQGSTVTASVETDTVDGVVEYRLEITGAGDVTFTDDNNVLQTLEVLTPEIADEVQSGQDAVFSVDGVEITRQSNVVNGVIQGVTLVLNSADPGNPVTLNISQDTSSITTAIQNFVTNYNTARSYIREQTSYDAETQTAGALLGDSAVLMVERNMFDIVGTRIGNILLQDLSDLNDGSGVDSGRIQITDRSGETAEIDLSSVSTVQGVVNLINANNNISVVAEANSAGDGLILRDTSGGTGSMTVEDLDGGTLAEDLGLAQSVSNNVMYGASVTDAGLASLTDLGISTNSNGTLSLDLSALSEALTADPKRVERMFSVRNYGIAQIATDKLQFITQSEGGTISNRTTAIQNVIDDIDERIEFKEKQLLAFEERLQRTYATLELTLAEYQSQSEYLTNQLADLGNVYLGYKN